jgi:Uncharacterised nucleotidyltransferase
MQCFSDSFLASADQFRKLSSGDWKRLLRWLDTSGLALYFLQRMAELRRNDLLPPAVLARLQQSLLENTERTRALIDESSRLQRAFEDAGLPYAVMKGLSLWPESVPDPCLRSQLDLDYLVTEEDAPAAQRILEGKGYYLHAVSGDTWEFKTHHMPSTSLQDLYRPVSFRCVELHVEGRHGPPLSLLARATRTEFGGVLMPVLSPTDMLLGQALHLYKHICSEFSRAAHFLEFRRHVMARSDDDQFWNELRTTAGVYSSAPLALGVATLLTTQLMGEFAPVALTCWTVDHLPASVRVWVEWYADRSALGNFPGSKLYLLLQRELQQKQVMSRRTLRGTLVPIRLPAPIVYRGPNETATQRLRRYRLYGWWVGFRLHFHVVEGIRFLYESLLWNQRKSRIVVAGQGQVSPSSTYQTKQ